MLEVVGRRHMTLWLLVSYLNLTVNKDNFLKSWQCFGFRHYINPVNYSNRSVITCNKYMCVHTHIVMYTQPIYKSVWYGEWYLIAIEYITITGYDSVLSFHVDYIKAVSLNCSQIIWNPNDFSFYLFCQ